MATMNFPNFGTFDFGRVVGNVESIKGQRVRNQMLGTAASEQKNVIDNREKARQVRSQHEQTPAQIEALERDGHFEEADKLRTSYITQTNAQIKMMEGLSRGLTKENWKQFRQEQIQIGAVTGSLLPVEFSQEWLNKQVTTKQNDLKVLTRKWEEDGVTMAQDVTHRGGQVLDMGKPYQPAADIKARNAGASGVWKSGDSNSLAEASAAVFGGFYDPLTRRFSGLNKEQQQQVLGLTEEGERLFRESGGQMGHRQAIAQAARNMGIEIPRVQPNNDPLGIRSK